MGERDRLTIGPPEDWQAECLVRWLLDWELMQVPHVDSEATETETEDGNVRDACVSPADVDIEPGQIRLMMPQLGDEKLLYLAIVGEGSEGSVFCVPFSPLSEPATPDELLSGRDTPVVRVFCLWNTRRASLLVLRESWIVDRLTAEELKRLERALLACEQTGSVPGDLRREAGPPLIHPEDPRRLYRRAEKDRIHNSLIREHTGDASDNVILYTIETDPLKLPKAAEDHDTYET
jgi:hypothetical protein